jgi:small subunit ribosomal protein S11
MSENNTTKITNEDKKSIKKTAEKTESKKVDVENSSKSIDKTETTTEKVVDKTTEAPVAKKKRKKVRRQVRRGRAYIKSSYNNTLVLFTDMHGNSLVWSSAGLLGFKGAKKATTYAANQVVLDADEKVQKYGLKDIEVFVRGVGSGRDAALRALVQKGYNLLSIKDITPVPHNGCRPKKPRRV